MTARIINSLSLRAHSVHFRFRGARRWIGILSLVAGLLSASSLVAQTAGEGGLEGTVLDTSGAIIPGASVTATNLATGIAITRQTTSAGLYSISPIIPGTYSVSATAPGFATAKQESLSVDALTMTNLNLTLHIGSQSTQVTVTLAPPQLDTTNATIGLTIENQTYSNLPLQMNNGMRDPTAFGTLAPGAQGGARLPLIGGIGNYLGQLYLDGLPAETVSQQGDNRLVSEAVSVDAINQMQVVTSTPPPEYSGAGAENFTMKSGGLQYHGRSQILSATRHLTRGRSPRKLRQPITPWDRRSLLQSLLSIRMSCPLPSVDMFRMSKGSSFSSHLTDMPRARERITICIRFQPHWSGKGILPSSMAVSGPEALPEPVAIIRRSCMTPQRAAAQELPVRGSRFRP